MFTLFLFKYNKYYFIIIKNMELTDIPNFEKWDATRLRKLTKRIKNLSDEEQTERVALIYLQWANLLKDMATDEFINDPYDRNYEKQALKQYDAYLKLTDI